MNGCDNNKPTLQELNYAYQERLESQDQPIVDLISIKDVKFDKQWKHQGKTYYQIEGDLVLNQTLYYYDPIIDGAFNLKGKGAVKIVIPTTNTGTTQPYRATIEVNKKKDWGPKINQTLASVALLSVAPDTVWYRSVKQ